jgi:hypothetical protein
MLTFYINRAGKNLSKTRRESLEKAKTILSGIIADQKESSTSKHSHATKKTAAHKAGGRSTRAAAHSTKRAARKAA